MDCLSYRLSTNSPPTHSLSFRGSTEQIGWFVPSSKEDSFLSLLRAESHTRWKALAWRSFFSGNGPWGPAPRVSSHIPRESQSNLQTTVPCSRTACSLQGLGLSFVWASSNYNYLLPECTAAFLWPILHLCVLCLLKLSLLSFLKNVSRVADEGSIFQSSTFEAFYIYTFNFPSYLMNSLGIEFKV